MQDCPIQGYFSKLSIADTAHLLHSRKISVRELIQNTLDSISQLDRNLNAFCHVDVQHALAQAQEIDALFEQNIILSPLQGIPVAIKDNIDTANLITSMGSNFYKDFIPKNDADCVQVLKSLGAIIIGKTNTNEFAYGPTGDCSAHGATLNPWNLEKISGGSSCGSAVAVATGMVPLALGTDTGGSIRIPASLNGIFGFKPSYGKLSLQGVFPLSESLDHLGILTKDIHDLQLVWNLFQQTSLTHSDHIETSSEFNIAWLPNSEITSSYDLNIYRDIKNFISAKFNPNLQIIHPLNELFSDIQQCFNHIQSSEAYAIHAEHVEHTPDLFQKEVLERLLASKKIAGWQYVLAKKKQIECINQFKTLCQEVDFILMPTLPISAPNLYERSIHLNNHQINVKEALLSLTSPWNVLGFPVCSVPLLNRNGLPIGLQVIAVNQSEQALLQFIQENFN